MKKNLEITQQISNEEAILMLMEFSLAKLITQKKRII